jgi:hypothetical protein
MPLYWLCYRHNNQISVVIEPGASPIHAGREQRLLTWIKVSLLKATGQADDLMSVDNEGYLLLTR